MQDQPLLLPVEGRAMVQSDFPFRNCLLRSLARDERPAFAALLDPLELPIHLSFEKPGQDVDRVCFPEHGVISVVAQGGRQNIEVGLIGHEGMTGGAVVRGVGRSANDVYVQIEGDGHCIDADDLRALTDSHPSIREPILRYFYVFGVQAAHSAPWRTVAFASMNVSHASC
jgi:hypothetical protein